MIFKWWQLVFLAFMLTIATALVIPQDRELAILKTQSGNDAQAIPILGSHLASNPGDLPVLKHFQVSMNRTGQRYKTRDHLRNYLQTDPDNWEIRRDLLNIEKDLTHLRSVVDLLDHPTLTLEQRLWGAQIRAQIGDLQGATDIVEALVQQGLELEATVLADLGQWYFDNEEHDKALDTFRLLVGIDAEKLPRNHLLQMAGDARRREKVQTILFLLAQSPNLEAKHYRGMREIAFSIRDLEKALQWSDHLIATNEATNNDRAVHWRLMTWMGQSDEAVTMALDHLEQEGYDDDVVIFLLDATRNETGKRRLDLLMARATNSLSPSAIIASASLLQGANRSREAAELLSLLENRKDLNIEQLSACSWLGYAIHKETAPYLHRLLSQKASILAQESAFDVGAGTNDLATASQAYENLKALGERPANRRMLGYLQLQSATHGPASALHILEEWLGNYPVESDMGVYRARLAAQAAWMSVDSQEAWNKALEAINRVESKTVEREPELLAAKFQALLLTKDYQQAAALLSSFAGDDLRIRSLGLASAYAADGHQKKALDLIQSVTLETVEDYQLAASAAAGQPHLARGFHKIIFKLQPNSPSRAWLLQDALTQQTVDEALVYFDDTASHSALLAVAALLIDHGDDRGRDILHNTDPKDWGVNDLLYGAALAMRIDNKPLARHYLDPLGNRPPIDDPRTVQRADLEIAADRPQFGDDLLLQRARATTGSSTTPWIDAIDRKQWRGDSEGVYTIAEEAWSVHPDEQAFAVIIMSTAAGKPDHHLIVDLFTELHKRFPLPDPRARRLAILSAEALRRYPLVIEWSRKAPLFMEDHSDLWFVVARAYVALGNYQSGDAAFAAYTDRHRDGRAWYEWGLMRRNWDRPYQRQFATANRILHTERTTSAFNVRAAVAIDNGQVDQAHSLLLKSRALEPLPPHPSADLADIHLRAQQPEKALAVINEALMRYPDHYRLQRTRGAILTNLNRFKEAEDYLRILAANYPEDRDIAAELAYVYERQGETQKAQKWYGVASGLGVPQ